MGRVLLPARHAQIDLRHRPVAKAHQESTQLFLKDRRKGSGGVPAGQLSRGLCRQDLRGGWIRANLGGQLPQLQVHVRGDVVGQAAQHCLQFPGPGYAAQQPAGRSQQREPGGRRRDDLRHHLGESPGHDAVHKVHPLHGGCRFAKFQQLL